eukprot:3372771-Pleurochrysis_carterae.AAC.1
MFSAPSANNPRIFRARSAPVAAARARHHLAFCRLRHLSLRSTAVRRSLNGYRRRISFHMPRPYRSTPSRRKRSSSSEKRSRRLKRRSDDDARGAETPARE